MQALFEHAVDVDPDARAHHQPLWHCPSQADVFRQRPLAARSFSRELCPGIRSNLELSLKQDVAAP